MMRLRQATSPKRDDDRVLPLINVVFLLLIFFMLAGTFAVRDPFDLQPPRSVSEGGDDPDLMVVQVGKGGEIAIDGEVIAPVELEQILQEHSLATKPPAVRIKAHGAATAPAVIDLIARLGDAGIEDLRLMTVARQP